MADEPKVFCLEPYCPELLPYGSGSRCAKHRREANARRKTSPWYSADGQRFRDHLKGCGNTICQRVVNGVRCKDVARFFHHIIDQKAQPRLIFDYRNVVAVCDSHHPPDTDSEQDSYEYVPTVYRAPMTYDPLPEPVAWPGMKVPDGKSGLLWTRPNRLRELVSGEA